MDRRAFLRLLATVACAPALPSLAAEEYRDCAIALNALPVPGPPRLMFHKDAFHLITSPRTFVVSSVTHSRADILFGVRAIKPDLMCQVFGKQAGARARRRLKRQRQTAALKTRPDGMVETTGWSETSPMLKPGDIVTFGPYPNSLRVTRLNTRQVEADDCGNDDWYDD